jgi:uncharacterized membrane protein
MEPEWMEQISSKTVCDFYYIIFIVYAVLAAIAVVNVVVVFFLKIPLSVKLTMAVQGIVAAALLVVLSMFQYIVCDRALLSKKAQQTAEGFYSKAGHSSRK